MSYTYTLNEINLSGRIFYYTEKSAQKYVLHDVYYSSTHQRKENQQQN